LATWISKTVHFSEGVHRMTKILAYIRRVFSRQTRPVPSAEYWPASALPGDPNELVKLGIVREWRIDHLGEPWFSAEAGVLSWYEKNLAGGSRDDA